MTALMINELLSKFNEEYLNSLLTYLSFSQLHSHIQTRLACYELN